MALPMVHLLAAWAFAQDKPSLRENPDYYLGTISPDAVHVRDGNDKSHKDEIHLNNWRKPDPDSVLRYWTEHKEPFDIGYGIHVLLDGQWAVGFRKSFPQILLPDGRPDAKLYYNDTCITDFELYRTSTLTAFLMDMVRKGNAPDDHPLLRKYEFDAWQKETLKFYLRPCPMDKPVQYIGQEYVHQFLKECLDLMEQTYERMLKMNDTQKSILERRSNRGFSDVALTEQEKQMLVDAALASPTACNFQDWHFCFVTNQQLLQQFSEEYREILLASLSSESEKKRESKYDVFFHAPLVVFITLPEVPRSRFAQVDAGIAVENLALAAQGMGLGSVILGRPKDLLTSENGKMWGKKLGFPEGHRFAIAIAIGHPTVSKDAHPIGENKVSWIN